MKTIKPQKLSVLCRTFEAAGRINFCVTTLVAAPFDAPKSAIHEAALWKFLMAELGKDTAPDICMPKLRGEVLVTGRAYTRVKIPQPACSVRLKVGPVDKTLWVVGNRVWKGNKASDPVPFTEMPIVWSNAFGGEGHPTNPTGKGFTPAQGEGFETYPLPNVEDPKRLIGSPKDRPEPAGFGPYDMTSPERWAKTGTYDETWLKEQFPGLPLDFDFSIYNTAPLDQRLDGYFRGDETFSLENMNPEKAVVEGRLPGFVSRAFVALRGGEFREMSMRLDTVHLFPGVERMLLLFRGVTSVVEDDASDVLQLVAGCEEMGPKKPVEHYKAVLAERLDKKRGALASLRDTDLMPIGPSSKVAMSEIVDPDLGTPLEHLKRKNMRRRAQHEIDAARERLTAAGLDPDEHMPKELPPDADLSVTPLDEVEEMISKSKVDIAKLKAEAEEKRIEAEAQARKQCKDAGLDYDTVVAEQEKKGGGPPKFSAEAERTKIRDVLELAKNAGVPAPEVEAHLADQSHWDKLRQTEHSLFDMYRKHAHLYPSAPLADAALTARARIELPAGAQGGVSFAGRDLTGVDLSGLDLRNIDLSSALLEGANLKGANLACANLTGTVLARADLTDVDLSYAKLARCNFGKARLVRAKFLGGVDMTRAVLTGADLTNATFRGAHLDHVDMSEATFSQTDFEGVVAESLNFIKTDLTGLKLTSTTFKKCNFIEVDLSGVDLSGADLTQAAFVSSKVERAVLRGATLVKLRVVQESSFAGSDFSGAQLERANLRGTKLSNCDFSRANVAHADFSDCDLRSARFDRAMGREVRFTQADLSKASFVDANMMFAVMDRAKAHGTLFLGANLFRADLAKMDVDGSTSMTDANLKQIRFVQAKR